MKKDKSILFFGLFFAASVLAEVYCIVEKINIIGVSVIVLIAAVLFLDCLRHEKERSEERRQAFLEDKIDELEKIQKAIYVQTERNSKAIRECLIKMNNSENRLAQDIMENQLNTAKLIIKNNREDLKKVSYIGKLSDEKVISVLNKNTDKLVRELKRNVAGNSPVKPGSTEDLQQEAMASANMAAEALETQVHPTALEALSAGNTEEKPPVTDMPDLEEAHTETPDLEANETEIPDIDLPDSEGDIEPEEDLQKISIDMSPEEMLAMLAAEEEEAAGNREPEAAHNGQEAEGKTVSAEPADPSRQLSPDEIAAMFASTEPAAEEPEEEPADPGRQLSPDETAAMSASTEARAEEPAEDLGDPNVQLSQDDIAAMFAALEDSGSEESGPQEELAAPAAEGASDPNHQMSPDEIAALFNSIGQ